MQTKPISIMAVVQTAPLVIALFCAGSAARSAEKFGEFISQPPSTSIASNSAFFVRDYGWWCILLIVAWVASALWTRKSVSVSSGSILGIHLLGAFLILGFLVAAIVYVRSALRPFFSYG